MSRTNETHDPHLTSWVDSANGSGTDFPIQNLPFGVFRRKGAGEPFRGGVAIGDRILDLRAACASGAFEGDAAAALAACCGATLNAFMAMGPSLHSLVRRTLSKSLAAGSAAHSKLTSCLVAQAECEHAVPAAIGDYTDFYTSIHHATAIGRLFRPDNPLLPNYKWVPIGYHGRSSTIGVSGQQFPRPVGQTLAPGKTEPDVGPSRRLDYELELGVFIGTGNAVGTSIPIADADEHIFGVCLLNDWSARDIQAWEYQPLGPFLSKNFATTISPWIVTLEALAPFRTALTRPEGDPKPLPYLASAQVAREGALDIRLSVAIETSKMRVTARPPVVVARTSYRHAYWAMSQLVTHHTVNGCELRPGDLLGTGTLSGPSVGEEGALIEATSGGKKPLTIDGEARTFLEDGDAVILRGWCEREGFARIGLGEAVGRVLPANA
ncbi:MAG TPA: fumarylacetoacetase [Casimicrobiaceae bacterium]|nr:fumarylacetoacetase [Casimicrobiaceae bacterium]